MKRRQFLTTTALTAIGASLAPQILKGQDPYVEYARIEQELTEWYVTPRLAKHNQSNNHWHLLQIQSEWGYGDVLQQWNQEKDGFFKQPLSRQEKFLGVAYDGLGCYSVEPNYPRSGRTMLPWDKGGMLYMHYAVPLRDYRNVYAHDGVGQSWMNVEDFVFYQQLIKMGEYSFYNNHLMGCGLVPGLVDPFMPRRRHSLIDYRELNYHPSGVRVYPVDSYEIHVMWRKR